MTETNCGKDLLNVTDESLKASDTGQVCQRCGPAVLFEKSVPVLLVCGASASGLVGSIGLLGPPSARDTISP